MQSFLLANPVFGVNPNGKGLYIFTLDIRYYALCIVTGMVIAACLSALLMKRRNMSPDLIFTLFIVCIPSAIVMARLFYCWTKPLPIQDWYKIHEGGLSIIGGVIGGVGAGLVVCLVKKISFLRAADCVVITILFAQAIGRLGNFFNQEVFGRPVTDPALQWAPYAVYIGPGNGPGAPAGWYQAFCFWEMFINLIGFALLFTFTWFRKSKPNGISMFLYFVWYGAVRAVMEPFRYQADILGGGGVMWSELFAILMVGFGVIGCLVLMIVNHLKEGKFIGSAKGDPCGITQYLTPYKNDPPYYSKINMFGAQYPPKPPKEKKGKKAAAENKTENKAENKAENNENKDENGGEDKQ